MGLREDYERELRAGLGAVWRSIEGDIWAGPQPRELALFAGGECPICHGYGGSHGPEHGFPGGWSCGTCAGSGKLGRVWLQKYLPYPENHPNKAEFERTGWCE